MPPPQAICRLLRHSLWLFIFVFFMYALVVNLYISYHKASVVCKLLILVVLKLRDGYFFMYDGRAHGKEGYRQWLARALPRPNQGGFVLCLTIRAQVGYQR